MAPTRCLAVVALLSLCAVARGELKAYDLRCEDWQNPIGIDVPQPRLSWKLASDTPADRQAAYEIRVSGDWGEVWDSGKVASGNTIQIPYSGKALASAAPYRWTVNVWDQDGKVTSAGAKWSMGLLSASDWKGQWIELASRPDPLRMPVFRRTFNAAKPVRRAVIFICGLGQFELDVNEKPATENILEPGWTDYRKTCLYCTYDITDLLKPGRNDLDVAIGNGMYDVPAQRYHKFTGSFGEPMMIAQLELEYADGSRQTIASDSSWQAAAGPVTFSSTYGGEDYDARLVPTQETAAVITQGPGGRLAGLSRSAPPVKVRKIFTPVSQREVNPGVTVYDLGQNCAMIPEVTVAGPAGAQVTLIPGELVAEDGAVKQVKTGKSTTYSYTCADDKPVTWHPRFAYYSARYVQVEGNAKVLGVRGLFISGDEPRAGTFECSNDLFNRTATLIDWSIRSNMVSLLTDCPHREKLGWLEQVHLMGPSLMYDFDQSLLMAKTCSDMEDAQHDDGMVPNIAPEYTRFKGAFQESPEWGAAAVLTPWQLYRWYGDLDGLRQRYPMMQRYVAFLGTRAQDGILDYGLGDWYDLGPKGPGVAQLTPKALTATAFYYRDLTVIAQAAKVLGDPDAAARYNAAAYKVRAAFNAKFYDAAKHRYSTGSQAADSIPVVFGMAPDGDAAAVVDDLVADIRSHQNALTAGDVGYRYVLQALAEAGRSDVIFDMNSRSDRPGYGYQLAHGATSLTEAWNADRSKSQDHFMLGHILEWFYSGLAGIQQAPGAVAFDHVRIRPAMVGDVTWVRASYESCRGAISVNWRRDAGAITLQTTLPPGCAGEIFVPAKNAESVKAPPGAAFVRMDGAAAVFAVPSGRYSFLSQ